MEIALSRVVVAKVIKSHVEKQKAQKLLLSFCAVRTGLEPATPCVTGMYSNQLNYRTCCFYCASFEVRVQMYNSF